MGAGLVFEPKLVWIRSFRGLFGPAGLAPLCQERPVARLDCESRPRAPTTDDDPEVLLPDCWLGGP